MAVDVLERLRDENPRIESRPVDDAELFAQIVARPRRASRRVHRRRLSRRRFTFAVLVALAVAAPLALAARSAHVLDFVFGNKPPKQVRQLFENALPAPYGIKEGPPQSATKRDVIRSSERMVAQITTRSGKVARLWVADLRTGGACFVAIGGPFNGGACNERPLPRKYPLEAPSGSRSGRTSARIGTDVTLFGRATSPQAASIVVYYKDGKSDLVRLNHTWFLYEVPPVHELRGHEPVRIDVLSASGQVIAKQNDPFGLHPPHTGKAERPVEPYRLLARESLHFKGAVVELQSALGDQGHRCIRVLNTGDTTQTRNWWCAREVGQTTPSIMPGSKIPGQAVFFELHQFTKFGRPEGYVYARGWVGPKVASLEIRFQDSVVQRIALHERFFVYVVPADRWALGKRPSYVIARDAGGRIVYRRFLYPQGRCAYPVADKRCATTIVHNG
jgi:hypothetical protein